MKATNFLTRLLAALRAACLAACLLALLDVGLPELSRRRVSYILIDASDSIGRSGIEESRRSAMALTRLLPGSDSVGLIAFARKPRLISRPTNPKQAERIIEEAPLESSDSGDTDLGLALSLAQDLLKAEKGEKSVILFGDGRSTTGAPVQAERLARSGARVYAYPVGSSAGTVASLGLEAPEAVRAGESAKLTWRLRSEDETELSYSVKVDGAVEHRGKASIGPGEGSIGIEVPGGKAGDRIVEVEARGPDGNPLPLASSGALLRSGGERAVLAVHGGSAPSPVSTALRLQGIRAVDGAVDALPESLPGYSDYSAVVLDDVSALSLTESRQRALVDFVASGGGLLVFGGYSSLGRGEYYSTVIEDALPVQTDTRQRLFFSRAKILFVIDHSGSMSDLVGGVSKQMAAMRGVAASIPELNPQDEVGVMSFDSSPTWVLPFTSASSADVIKQAIQAVPEGGGTDMSSAIEEILRGFGEAGPNKRHVVILTDGLTQSADFQGLSAKLKLNGITVSTIGIGDEVNEALLRDLAQWNDGFYYRAAMDEIPKIIKKETVRVTRDLIQEGRFAARLTRDSPVLDGLRDDLPEFSGYLIAKAKPLAEVLLETRSLSGGASADPLMVLWRYGNGWSCVFTSDSGRAWLSGWAGHPAYKRLWAQTLRGIERSVRDEGLQARAALASGRARIAVEAQEPDGRASVGRSLSAFDASGGSGAVRLTETAPGRYEGQLPLSAPGLRVFQIRDEIGGGWTRAWLWNPGGAEMASAGPDTAFLSELAQSGRGRLLAKGSLGLPKPALAWIFLPARLPLIVLALVLLLTELYCRSALFGQLAMAKATLAAWFKGQSALVDDLERRGDSGDSSPAPWSPDDSGKAMNAYRRLAERYRDISAKR